MFHQQLVIRENAINSSRGRVCPSPHRVEKRVHLALELCQLKQVSPQCLRQLTGLMALCHSIVHINNNNIVLFRLEKQVHSVQLTQVSSRCLHQLTRLIALCHSIVPLSMFHLHSLESFLRDHFDMRIDQPTKLIPLSSPVVQSSLKFGLTEIACLKAVPTS